MEANLCKEIIIPGYPKTSTSLNRLMPKYQFSRAKWYVAEVSWNNYIEAIAWCTDQFGSRPKVSDAWTRWFDNYGDRIFFRDEKDYMWFMMRWS